MNLETIDRDDDITHVALVGSLDIAAMHTVDVTFHAQTALQGRPTITDLSGVEFISSLGVGMLIACAVSLRRRGAAMVIVCPPGDVREVLDKGRVDLSVPLVGTIQEAEMCLRSSATS